MDVVNNKSCRSNLHQNPGQYQNLDFVQREKIPTKFIPTFKTIVVSRVVWEKFDKRAANIQEMCSVVCMYVYIYVCISLFRVN